MVVAEPCFLCAEMDVRGYNSIGRKVTALGYVLDNIIPCCTVCSRLKQNCGGIENYLAIAEHILVHNGRMEEEEGSASPELFPDFVATFERAQRGARERNMAFDLTPAEYESITVAPCYMCGKENSSTHHNGIDRFDNAIGYTPENMRSCCTLCNRTKWTFQFDEVLDKMQNAVLLSRNVDYDETEN